MKLPTILALLFSSLAYLHAQEVTLTIHVLYDGEKPKSAGKSTVYFSDGQMVATNGKGVLSRNTYRFNTISKNR
ncbi:MAG: hypothetical protein IPP15_00085 [Saprospiraceae bacterium]|uniref:Uncharacterized protein n=1 Tax=Candidatus Opimibacter skivensis TaxID=2982028 RepID=A0A9D7SRJ5_9BACT|nr:hypothetical protein [Candidatus Opimibacter skivensis]